MSVLEFIVALKWPSTVLILAGLLTISLRRSPDSRTALRDWLSRRDIRLKVGGQELQTTLAQAADSMSTAAVSDEALAATVIERIAAANNGDVDLSQYPAPSPEDLGMLRRDAVEDVMRNAAEWGWRMAHHGLRQLPELEVEWNDEGRPDISMVAFDGINGPDPFASAFYDMRCRPTLAAEREYVTRLQHHWNRSHTDRPDS